MSRGLSNRRVAAAGAAIVVIGCAALALGVGADALSMMAGALLGVVMGVLITGALIVCYRPKSLDQHRASVILAQLPAIVWTTDTDFRVRSFSCGSMPCVPVSPKDSLGRCINEVLHASGADHSDEDDDGAITQSHRRALLGDSVECDLHNFVECGRDLDVMVEPLVDENRNVIGCVGLALDITERRRSRRAEQERKDLHRAAAAMEQVLTVIGHELRTPLAALRVMSEHLLNDDTSCTFLHSIHDEVIRLSKMVNDLLEAATIPHEGAPWDMTQVSLAEVCDDAVAMIAPLIDRQRVTIQFTVTPHDLSLYGNPCSIHRLIVNLLSNAQRHTQEGTISLRARRYGNRFIELSVHDTGAGIPDCLAGKLGVAFALNGGIIGGGSSNDPAGRDPEQRVAQLAIGSGLGLAICNRIAEAHGGSLRIDSEVGRGTTVTVRLRADLKPASTQ